MAGLQGIHWFSMFTLLLTVSLTLGKKKSRCEEIKIPFCKGLGYNTTIFPNNLAHDTQEEAKKSATEFTILVESQCSPEIALFLCSLFAPVCTQMHKALPPCRSLCKNSRDGCENLMNKFGFAWPERFECTKFPEEGLCVGRNTSASSQQTKNLKPGKLPKLKYSQCGNYYSIGLIVGSSYEMFRRQFKRHLSNILMRIN